MTDGDFFGIFSSIQSRADCDWWEVNQWIKSWSETKHKRKEKD